MCAQCTHLRSKYMWRQQITKIKSNCVIHANQTTHIYVCIIIMSFLVWTMIHKHKKCSVFWSKFLNLWYFLKFSDDFICNSCVTSLFWVEFYKHKNSIKYVLDSIPVCATFVMSNQSINFFAKHPIQHLTSKIWLSFADYSFAIQFLTQPYQIFLQ